MGAIAVPSVASILSSCDSSVVPTDDFDSIMIEYGTMSLGGGLSSTAILTNGTFLGPTIRARTGENISISFQNNLSEISNIHWHGLTVPAGMDGHPMDAVPAGGSFTYSFDVIDRPGTYWYHAHPDMLTAKQVYMGHAGFFIISSAEEDALGLPTGANDIPLLLQDKRLDAGGQMLYAPARFDKITGWLGNDMVVNGKKNATQSVAQELYRLRLLNGSNARVFKAGFADGRMFNLIANDGGLLDVPVQVDHVFLSSGERADILVSFESDSIGANPVLKTLPFPFVSEHQNDKYPQGAEHDLITFTVDKPKTNTYTVPAALLPYEKLDAANAVGSKYFQLTMDHDATYGMHRINNLAFEMHRKDFTTKLGELEAWEFENQGDSIHNMHVHGTQFQIVERNFSSANLTPTDKGWKDTVLMWPSETVKILVRFNTYKGLYLLHCHNLEHEDDGMMVNVDVV